MTNIPAQGSSEWMAVALAQALCAGDVMRVELEHKDLVVWRGHDMSVHCFDNRCPHRGMRLSFGFVRGSRLNCIYHGWQYGAGGGCQHIPAHPNTTPPDALTVATYSCCEFDGLIWINQAPDPAPLDQPLNGHAVRSIAVQAPISRVQTDLSAGLLRVAPWGGPATTPMGRLVFNHSTVNLQLFVTLQAGSSDKTHLHVQVSEDVSSAEKIEISRWLDALRSQLEISASLPQVTS